MKVLEHETITTEIWSELRSNLFRFILRRTGNEADAEDILQDVFVKIYRGSDRLDDTGKLHAWVYQITRNAIADHYRKKRPEISIDEIRGFDIAQETAPSHNDREEIISCLNPMLERLPEQYRSAIKLADIDGMPQVQMAEQLNVSVSGAKSRVQRARGKVKEMLSACCEFEFDRLGRAVGMSRNDCSSC